MHYVQLCQVGVFTSWRANGSLFDSIFLCPQLHSVLSMGCILTKQPETKFDILEETKVFDVPCWERLEWENLLRKNDLAMDQINLELTQNNLREQEHLMQQRNRNLEVENRRCF